ncbi:MAG: hypothetical protein UZ21_OP11001000285 [Microgenomates bacterium OLB22]|nr:MAG: hypothetical protein UZ21_OP11001000285 [Microgenomates bacterium OLB22]
MYWWPFFYNGKILLRILDRKGLAEFLKWLGVLVDYPIELYLANDLDNVVDRLVTIKSEQSKVEKLFSKLIERNSKYYEYKQKWLRQVTKK